MKILKIPNRYKKQLSRLDPDKRLWIYDSLMEISLGENINVPDSMEGDIFELIWRDCYQMEKKNGKQGVENIGEALGLAICDGPAQVGAVDSHTEVKGSEVKVKRNEVKRSEVKKTKVFSLDSDVYKLSNLLLSEILKNNQSFKKPDLNKWSAELDKIIRIDCRNIKEIEAIILWSQQDTFWRQNILSVNKLRKHFDTMWVKAKAQYESNKNNLTIIS